MGAPNGPRGSTGRLGPKTFEPQEFVWFSPSFLTGLRFSSPDSEVERIHLLVRVAQGMPFDSVPSSVGPPAPAPPAKP